MVLEGTLLLGKRLLDVIAFAGKHFAVVLVELVLAHQRIKLDISNLESDSFLLLSRFLSCFLFILSATSSEEHSSSRKGHKSNKLLHK